jgi:AcrR family transcriptional regulator
VPLSDCEIRDPRMRRTRQLLQGALHNLMQSKSFDEILVQDITDAATVNRATFYDHYCDKYALLNAMIAGGFHRLLDERKVEYNGTCSSAASAIILAACDYVSESVPADGACPRQSAFEPLLESAITHAIRRVILEGMHGTEITPGPSREMIATTASWAIFGAVKEWSRTPDRAPAQEIVPVILQMVVPILNAAAPLPLGRTGV